MKTFEIFYVKTVVEQYEVNAEDGTAALKHIEDECGKEGERIKRREVMDKVTDAHYQCEGEVTE